MKHETHEDQHFFQIPLIRYLTDALLSRVASPNSPKKKNEGGGGGGRMGRRGRAAGNGRLNGGDDNAMDTNGSNDHTAR